MPESSGPQLQRYKKFCIGLEVLIPSAELAESESFLADLATLMEKHGVRAESGGFGAGTGPETPGLMMKIPYGVADF